MKSSYRVASAKYQEPGKEPPRTEGGTPCGAVALDERLTTAHPTSTGLGVSLRRTKEHPGPANDSDPGRVSPKPASATDAMSEYEPVFTTLEQTPTRLRPSVPLVEGFNRAVAVFSEAGQGLRSHPGHRRGRSEEGEDVITDMVRGVAPLGGVRVGRDGSNI